MQHQQAQQAPGSDINKRLLDDVKISQMSKKLESLEQIDC